MKTSYHSIRVTLPLHHPLPARCPPCIKVNCESKLLLVDRLSVNKYSELFECIHLLKSISASENLWIKRFTQNFWKWFQGQGAGVGAWCGAWAWELRVTGAEPGAEAGVAALAESGVLEAYEAEARWVGAVSEGEMWRTRIQKQRSIGRSDRQALREQQIDEIPTH